MKAQTIGTQYGSGQGTDPVGWTCMTGQRAQKECPIRQAVKGWRQKLRLNTPRVI